jgi:glucoamylase
LLAIAAALVAASLSGATEQAPEPIATAMPAPHFGTVASGPFSPEHVRAHEKRLGKATPRWARRLYRRSIRVLVALTDPRSGAMIAGERDGWDYVWPRDAAAGAIALQTAGLHAEASRVVGFLSQLDLEDAARFYSDGSRVPGRSAAGDGEGWVEGARRFVSGPDGGFVPLNAARSGSVGHGRAQYAWTDRQDYGENVTGDLLGNAIAAGAPAADVEGRFFTARGLVRENGSDDLDSAAAWAATIFPQPALRAAVKTTLVNLTRESTPYGIPPMAGWTPGEVWTAPTAWSAWALIDLGDLSAADRLLAELHRAETPAGTLPERVDAEDGHPTSTTPLAWSHAFAILALRARYGGGL